MTVPKKCDPMGGIRSPTPLRRTTPMLPGAEGLENFKALL